MAQENISETRMSDSQGSEKTKMFFKKSRGCPLCGSAAPKVDYKNPDMLKQFISEGGRMLPSRITNVCAKHQRPLKKAIKHSRVLALLPFTFARSK